jgi:hypothetical protein
VNHLGRPAPQWGLGAAAVGIAILLAFPVDAQQSAPPNPESPGQQGAASASSPQAASQSNNENRDKEKAEQEGTSNDRLFWTLPDFLTVDNEGKYPPLSVGQKFAVVTRSSFDYVEYPWYAAVAGISQAENSEPGYGQGAQGYAKRYGAAFADGTIENYMTAAVLPSLLHQDPRYYQLGRGGFWHRTEYAIGRLFITRSDSGQRQFNFSEVCGAFIAATISTYSYHPDADKNLPNDLSVWGTQIGFDGVSFVVKEFWPDIRRKLRNKKQSQPQ